MENNILRIEEVIENGVSFDANLGFGGPYDQGIVEYSESGEEILFTGLAYDLYDNGNLESYFYVYNGVKQGLFVSFFKNGKIKRIGNMDKSASHGLQIEYFENGTMKSESKRIAGLAMTYREYDEDGNIIDEKKKPTVEDLIYAEKFQ